MNGQQICPKICDRIPDMHFVNALYIVRMILSIDIFNKMDGVGLEPTMFPL